MHYASVAELVDALDLGSSGVTCGGSTPPARIFYLGQTLVWRLTTLLVWLFSFRSTSSWLLWFSCRPLEKAKTQMAIEIRSDIKETSKVERELSITVPGDQVAKELDRAYRRLSKKVRIKGFRAGKVPRYVLEQYYKPQTEQEVLEDIVGKSYEEAVKSHELSPVAPPAINAPPQLIPGMDYAYSATGAIKPEVTLAKTEGLKAERTTYIVNDKCVDVEIETLKQQQVKVVPVEDRDVVQQGDLAELNWSATLDGEPVKGMSGTSYVVEVGSGRFFDEAEQALVGKKLNESFECKVTLPDTYQVESLREKTVTLMIYPVELKVNIYPTVDDDFAQDVSDEYETLADLRSAIQTNLEKQAKMRTENEAREKILDALIAENSFEVPKALIERQAEQIGAEALSRFPREQAQMIWQANRDRLIQDALPRAERQVRVSLLLEALIKNNDIEVSDGDIESHLETLAERAGQPISTLKRLYKGKEQREMLKDQVVAERAIGLLIEKAEFSDAEKPIFDV